MRFDTLSECFTYAMTIAKDAGFLVKSFEMSPMPYNTQQRLTGPKSAPLIVAKTMKSSRKRLQVVVERFENGRYECIAYCS